MKRTIVISSPLRLSVRSAQLIMSTTGEEEEIVGRIPIEDLAHVIVENQRTAITIPALNELTARNVGVVICDSKSLPHAMLHPLDSNTLQGQRYRSQLEATLPAKKSIWQQLVAVKIRNQGDLLNRLGRDGDILKPHYRNVKSGDTDNREGIAARLYWPRLFGPDFLRSCDGMPPNNLLNYGYSILRAATTRAIVSAGMLPALGVHHRNRSNAFPLSDDFMEPFRPFVDEVVFQLFATGHNDLDKEAKGVLISVLHRDTLVNGKLHPLSVALTMLCTSAEKIMSGEGKLLSLPTFC